MATWAKGIDFKNTNNTARIGGVGAYGTDSTVQKLYFGLGTEPWNNAGLQLTSSSINFKGNKIYHAGDKPTASEIGAAPSSHTHSSLKSTDPVRPTSANLGVVADRSLSMMLSTSNMTTGKPLGDGYILNFNWDNNGGWASQLYVQNSSSPKMQVRGMNAGTWGEWNTLYGTNNKPTPAEIGAAASSHTHSYLPLSGGTMTGAITTPNNAQGIKVGDDAVICDRNVGNHIVIEGATATEGGITFGSGKDTNIYRGGANILKTDDTFNAVGGLQWNGQSLDARYMRQANANGYYGMTANGDTSNWVRTTNSGIIPYQSGGASSLGTSSWPFNNIYANNIYDNGTLLEDKFLGKTATAAAATKLATARKIGNANFDGTANISTGSILGFYSTTGSGNGTYQNKYTKIASIDISGGTYRTCTGILSFLSNESGVFSGQLMYYLRTGSSISSAAIALNWLSLNNTSYASSVVAVKTDDGKFDLYFKPVENYVTTGFVNFTSSSYITLYSSQPYVDTVTAAATSTLKTVSSSTTGNAATATTLQNARTINGTSFNGSANITTANWGTARTITIGNTGKSVNGSGNVSWTLSEIGAAASSHTHNYMPLTGGTFTGNVSIGSSAPSFTIKNTGGADTSIIFDRGSNANWRIRNTSGNLLFESDYASSKGSYYAGLTLNYNSGNLTAKGEIYANGGNRVYHTGNKPTPAEIGAAASSHTHNYAGSSSAGGAATTALACTGNSATATTSNYLASNTRMEYGWNGINYFNISGTAGAAAKANDTPTSAWWHVMRFNHQNSSGYYTDLAIPFNDTSLYYKRITNGSVQNGGWVKVLDSLNYNSYSPTKTGGGASGTWGISVSGNASTATTLQTARTINGTSFNGSGNITTANWGTARNITIADNAGSNTGAAVSVNGSGNVTLKLPATIAASLNGNASTATALTTSAGSSTQPIYFSGGKPVAGLSYFARSTQGDIGWGSANNNSPVTVSAIAYWNGAYQGTASNLTYCKHGAFGTIVTKNASDYAASSHTHNYAGSSSAGGAANSSNRMEIADTRNTNPSPSDFSNRGVTYDFKHSSAIGLSDSNYVGLMTMQQWSDLNGWSGGKTTQMAFGDSGSIYVRKGNGNGWDSWRTIAYTNSSITGNASTATKLQTTRAINGTNFDGTGNITTANWGTARNIQIGNTAKSVNGSANVTWTLGEIGAAASNHTHGLVNLNSEAFCGGNDLNTYNSTKTWVARTINTTTNRPHDYYTVVNFGANSNSNFQLAHSYGNNSILYVRGRHDTSGNYTPWAKVYTDKNKPTAADIGAATSNHTHNNYATGALTNSYNNGTNEPCEGYIHLGGSKYLMYGYCSISLTANVGGERTYSVPGCKRIYGITLSCYTKGGTGNFGEVALKQTYSDGFTFRLWNVNSGGAHYITYMIIGDR